MTLSRHVLVSASAESVSRLRVFAYGALIVQLAAAVEPHAVQPAHAQGNGLGGTSW